jgi:hypothetical protein
MAKVGRQGKIIAKLWRVGRGQNYTNSAAGILTMDVEENCRNHDTTTPDTATLPRASRCFDAVA